MLEQLKIKLRISTQCIQLTVENSIQLKQINVLTEKFTIEITKKKNVNQKHQKMIA